jgi:hypothetical protein
MPMPRPDLLALTLDDLTVLSNRGLVKRAQRELESAEFTYQFTESDNGTITLQWSDGFDCILPVDSVISDRDCTCTATTICRHLLRSILAYQQQFTSPATDTHESVGLGDTSLPLTNPSWNPGDISDTELAQHFKATQLKQLQRQFESSQVIELTGGPKPTARLHSSSHIVRFLVPRDLRYTYCDCAAPAPCSHIPLAIWAFRKLKSGETSGIISTETDPAPVTIPLLDDLEAALHELLKVGLRGLPDALLGRLQRLEQQCRSEVLIWPAEILVEILQECDRYRQRDARFSPNHLIELIGELCIRMDAIRNPTGAVPQLFIRGTKNDRTTELGAARLIGLGCGVQTHQQNLCLTSYFQDTDSGAVMAFSRHFTDLSANQAQPRKEFWQLAQAKVIKQTSMEQLGAGQLLIKGGKRSPDFQLLPRRSQLIINPQTFQWESLRAPLLVENYAELQAHLSLLPPSSLSPRRQTEALQVLVVHQVKSVKFCAVEQAVIATIVDLVGHEAILFFPYHQRAHSGVDALLANLTTLHPIFVTGIVRLKLNQIVITPISIVFQSNDTRILLQPWIHANNQSVHPSEVEDRFIEKDINSSPALIERYLDRWFEALSEILISGTEHNKTRMITTLENLCHDKPHAGFTILLKPWTEVTSQQNGTAMEAKLLELALILRLSQDYLC